MKRWLLTVLTRNLYFGADLAPLFSATTAPQFTAAATQAYLAAQASDISGRAQALAREIAAAAPDFVGIQEAAIWRTRPAGEPASAPQVQVNFAQLILDHLDGAYTLVAAQPGLDAEAPTGVGLDVRLTLQDLLLVRSGLTSGDLQLANVQMGNYTARLSVPLPVGEIAVPRQWVAVDAKIWGRQVRVISTHLEPFVTPIRMAQVQELLAGPAHTNLPTILMGDFNAQPGVAGDAAASLIEAGFVDVWPQAHPGAAGDTCCQAPDLRNGASQLDHRIDLILVRNGLDVVAAQRVGDRPINQVPSGVQWASDHAGVAATLALP